MEPTLTLALIDPNQTWWPLYLISSFSRSAMYTYLARDRARVRVRVRMRVRVRVRARVRVRVRG